MTDTSSLPSDIAAAVEAGRQQTLVIPGTPGYVRSVAIPNSAKLVPLPQDKLERPRFLVAEPVFHDPQAFIDYVLRYRDPFSRIWHTSEGVFTAVLDYHEQGAPRHGTHVARLELKRSPEWNAWLGRNEKPMGQQEFAEFIEDRIQDILKPDPQNLARVAAGLTATIGAKFKSAKNQANGQINLQYDEEINGKIDGSEAQVPTDFEIGIRPFVGTERYPVQCKLRYRVPGGSLHFFYKCLQVEPITEAEIARVADKIRQDVGITPALGDANRDRISKGQ